MMVSPQLRAQFAYIKPIQPFKLRDPVPEGNLEIPLDEQPTGFPRKQLRFNDIAPQGKESAMLPGKLTPPPLQGPQ